MATLFLPLSKNVSCTSTPQGKHLCQISWELVKTEEVVRDARLATDRPTVRPPARQTDRRHADSYIPPYTLRVCGGITKAQLLKTTIPRTINSPPGPLPISKTTHQDQYLHLLTQGNLCFFSDVLIKEYFNAVNFSECHITLKKW